MEESKRFRYDFFGEYLSENSSNFDESKGRLKDCNDERNQLDSTKVTKTASEDSLMEFISDYFQGSITEDFSEHLSIQLEKSVLTENSPDQKKLRNRRHEQTSAFNYSSSSEANTSMELFASREASIMNTSDRNDKQDDIMEVNEGICNADLMSPSADDDYQHGRRKSISYEIVFTNSKDKNGRVKIHIVPNKKSAQDKHEVQQSMTTVPSSPSKNGKLTLEEENIWLRQRIQDLERRLHCVETESERVVGELSKIIERKNETISLLELQIAGVRIQDNSNIV